MQRACVIPLSTFSNELNASGVSSGAASRGRPCAAEAPASIRLLSTLALALSGPAAAPHDMCVRSSKSAPAPFEPSLSPSKNMAGSRARGVDNRQISARKGRSCIVSRAL
eukprot:6172747-Pleurochrysis_carterae.AAC.10